MRKILEFTYELRYEELYEACLLLNKKCSARTEKILTVVLTVLAVILLGGYYLDNSRIHFFFLASMDILLLFYLLYVPEWKARSAAGKISRQSGQYRIRLSREGTVATEMGSVDLAGDKDARTVETKDLFVIRPDRTHTFCLPKRILEEEEKEEVRTIVDSNMKYYDQRRI